MPSASTARHLRWRGSSVRRLRWSAGAAALVASVALLFDAVDLGSLGGTFGRAIRDPVGLGAVLALYGLAFVVRAGLWTYVLPSLDFRQALAAIHVSLGGNHVLPLRLGEALRVTSVVRRTAVPPARAAASTLSLRAADVLAVVGIASVLGPRVMASTVGSAGWLLAVPAAAVWVAGALWLQRSTGTTARVPGVLVGAGAALAWLLESALVWQAAQWATVPVTPAEAALVTAVTIAAQVVAVAPGGIGTYEAAMTGTLVALGAPVEAALAAAVTAHALKTAYALVTGGIAAFVPAPGLFGRFRLPRGGRRTGGAVLPGPDAPIVLFLPAHNEESVVGDVVRRVPAVVAGRPTQCIVVDDGSTDGTAAAAAAAGALVVRQSRNLGLGAAVRRGLQEGVARRAAAVVFCDADGEYAPEELERMVEPILADRADYVIGSRFSGDIQRMLPHRRLGNRVLTRVLAFVARLPVTDGQSGYRALSPAAAADAEIVHDYNYAQVLTLDLLGKGYRYAEVPISYRFRDTGTSFVRLGRYLRHVVPAVHAELNGAPTGRG